MNILITGASRGLGLNHARILSESKKNKIIITDISEGASSAFSNKDKETFNKLLKKKNIHIVYSNLIFTKDIDLVTIKIKKIFKNKIDAIICNAGGDIPGESIKAFGNKSKINDYMISTIEFEQIYKRNFNTTFNILKKIIPLMKKNKYGKIITISSVNALLDQSNEFAYSTAKNAIIHFTKILARDLLKYNIQVNCICPGPTVTSRFLHTLKQRKKNEINIINKNKGLGRIAQPNDISNLIEFLLSKNAEILTGQIITADYGYSIGK